MASPKKTLGALLLVEGAPGITKGIVTIKSGSGVVLMGTVLALSLTAGKHIPLDQDATTAGDTIGSVTISTGPDVIKTVKSLPREAISVAVLAEDVDATDDDIEAVAIEHYAALAEDEIVWPVGITADQKALAVLQLKARGIVLRTTV